MGFAGYCTANYLVWGRGWDQPCSLDESNNYRDALRYIWTYFSRFWKFYDGEANTANGQNTIGFITKHPRKKKAKLHRCRAHRQRAWVSLRDPFGHDGAKLGAKLDCAYTEDSDQVSHLRVLVKPRGERPGQSPRLTRSAFSPSGEPV